MDPLPRMALMMTDQTTTTTKGTTMTASTQLARLTPHQHAHAMYCLRRLRPPTRPHDGYVHSDTFVVARSKRTVPAPTDRSTTGCVVHEVGSATALQHLARKGYLQPVVERRGSVEQTFYAVTQAGLDWYARQLERAARAAEQDDRIRAAATYSEGSDI